MYRCVTMLYNFVRSKWPEDMESSVCFDDRLDHVTQHCRASFGLKVAVSYNMGIDRMDGQIMAVAKGSLDS
ncbi:hypothetical protein J6590_091590 [Homalodisca vitripennis]|nr:hypothetical protein J6590_091590 [Homalodisca vitripennis]